MNYLHRECKKYIFGIGLVPVSVPLFGTSTEPVRILVPASDAAALVRTHSWGADDETPLGPLSENHNIIEPKPDRNLGCPLIYSFLVSAAYAPSLVHLMFTKQLSLAGSGTYPFGLIDPIGTLRNLTLIVCFVSVPSSLIIRL